VLFFETSPFLLVGCHWRHHCYQRWKWIKHDQRNDAWSGHKL